MKNNAALDLFNKLSQSPSLPTSLSSSSAASSESEDDDMIGYTAAPLDKINESDIYWKMVPKSGSGNTVYSRRSYHTASQKYVVTLSPSVVEANKMDIEPGPKYCPKTYAVTRTGLVPKEVTPKAVKPPEPSVWDKFIAKYNVSEVNGDEVMRKDMHYLVAPDQGYPVAVKDVNGNIIKYLKSGEPNPFGGPLTTADDNETSMEEK